LLPSVYMWIVCSFPWPCSLILSLPDGSNPLAFLRGPVGGFLCLLWCGIVCRFLLPLFLSVLFRSERWELRRKSFGRLLLF
jgi:hypothetical protein